MLAAQCPSCGAPAPVSLATPDHISCPSCRYTGAPSPEVRAQLRDAANALWAMDAGDRQLSDSQRNNLKTARSNLFILLFVLLIVLVPLLGLAGSCSVLAVSGEGFEPMSLVMVLGGCLPFSVGLLTAVLAVRHVRNRGRKLEERCAALPPAGAGEPARCHVCGGSLAVASKQGVVRCDFCRADNLVSDDVLQRMAQRRHLEVGKIGDQVRAEARALDKSALAAGAVAFGIAILSPFASVAFVIGAIIIGSEIELEPRTDATYALIQVTNAQCVAELRNGLDFRESIVGFEKRPLPAGVVAKKSQELVGLELGYADGKRGKVKRIFRDAISPSIDRVEMEVDGRIEREKLTSRCDVPKVRRTVATGEVFREANELRLVGDELWVRKQMVLGHLPKTGGALSILTAPTPILDFQPTANGTLIRSKGNASNKGPLERVEGDKREHLGFFECFAVDGDELLVGTDAGLFRRGEDAALTQLSNTPYVTLIHVTDKAIYWTAGGDIHERDKASGSVKKLGYSYGVLSMVVAGDFLAIVDATAGASALPLAGGETTRLDGGVFTKGPVRSDGTLAYFGLETSGSRGGVAGLVLGKRSASSDRHYGIDSGRADAVAVGAGEVFWISGETVFAEPVVPQ